jgi:uncharacterized protein
MPLQLGQKAIDRAVASLHRRGSLDLAFFGGEPVIEAELILSLVEYARRQASHHDIDLAFSMTTNGTFDSPAAWSIMNLAEMRLAISHDGLPSVHDPDRITIDGQPSSGRVLATVDRLIDAGKEFRVVMVVQPSSAETLPEGMEFLYKRGVRQFDPSLNLWAIWTRADGERLRDSIRRAADFWSKRLPDCSVSWFDEKTARLLDIPLTETARCGFGHGEIAVTPAGNLYPCERLVGADEPTNRMRLPGDVFAGHDFLNYSRLASRSPDECVPCALRPQCSTTICRCSNYVRTQDANRPDRLLCLLDQTCHEETVRVLKSRSLATV